MNAEGKNVISLGIGSPDMPPFGRNCQCVVRTGKGVLMHGYQPTVGIPELRKIWPTGTSVGIM